MASERDAQRVYSAALLVGHRGCGKTSLLGRIRGYRPDVEVLDLDERIAGGAGRSVGELFAAEGEERFRRREREVLAEILAEGGSGETVIALGAGMLAQTLWLWWRSRPDLLTLRAGEETLAATS